MKISYLAFSEIPSKKANSVHVMKMCHALASRNINVELVVPDRSSSNADPYEYYGIKKNFTIVRHKLYRTRIGLLFYSVAVIQGLLKEREQYVYGRDMLSCFLASLFGFKTVWESHAPISYMGPLFSRLFKIMISKKSYLKTVVISSTLKQYYIDNYKIPSDRIEVLPDCADELDFSNVVPLNLRREGYKAQVGYIGHLYPGKGMEIISQLVIKCPDVAFHIVGGNEKDVNYWEKELSNYKNVFFYGYVKPSEIPSYGLAMDILIAPYMRQVQGSGAKDFKQDISMWMSPLKLFEYMSYKKPIISSDLPVLHDVLNNDNSLMSSPDNIEEWISAINKLSGSPEDAKKLADRAFQDFINNYTWTIRAKKIIRLYE